MKKKAKNNKLGARETEEVIKDENCIEKPKTECKSGDRNQENKTKAIGRKRKPTYKSFPLKGK